MRHLLAACFAFAFTTAPTVLLAQQLPDLTVTSTTAKFVPYELQQNGLSSCIGPFMDLTFVVTNRGADFPHPSDLQVNRSRMVDEPEATMLYFNLYADMDFGAGPGSGGQHVIAVDKSKVTGGVLKSGAALEVPFRLQIRENQTSLRVSAKLIGGFMLKLANGKPQSEPYDSGALEIPVWDIYAQSHTAVAGTMDDAKVTNAVLTKADITNRGKSETPGPVRGNFVIRFSDGTPSIVWSGETKGPIAPGGTESIVQKTPVDKPLKPGYVIESGIQVRCPNGAYGILADGNVQDNTRTLSEQILPPAAKP
jgi:hypothetical protein